MKLGAETYIVGDIQGCYDEFISLIKILPKDADIFLCGDIVNRGNKSLAMLEWAKENKAKMVLGNHEIFLLAAFCGITKVKKTDTIDEILSCKDRQNLIDWLRFQPLIRSLNVENKKWLLVHAGLLPDWDVTFSLSIAKDIELELQGNNYKDFLRRAFLLGDIDDYRLLGRKDFLAFGLSVLTRIRYCTKDGVPNFNYDSHPSEALTELTPWYKVVNRKNANVSIVAGHWSCLGLHVDISDRIAMIDTGAVYGGELTAIKLSDRSIVQVSCKQYSFV